MSSLGASAGFPPFIYRSKEVINDNNGLEKTIATLLIIATIVYWIVAIQTVIEKTGEAF